MAVTAKVKLQSKTPIGEDEVQLNFAADYEDGRNKEWAKYTPGLSLIMSVKEAVGEPFNVGDPWTLTFEPSQD